MKIQIYKGALRIVERSGVGQAVHHQEAMLRAAGAEVTDHDGPDVDAVQINTVFPDSVLAAMLAKARGRTVLYYGHSTMEDFRNSFRCSNLAAPLFKKWIKFCYTRGDFIITPTEYSRSLLRSYGIRKPVYALSNGVDTERFRFSKERRAAFRARYGLEETDKVVISAGLLIERKGILDFVRLARLLPDVRFLWFGGVSRALRTSAVTRAIREKPGNVEFPGFVSQDELRDAYAGADLFCFMSREETEGIVVLEALSSGIPVLVRDIPAYRGWLRDGVNVWKAAGTVEFAERAAKILAGEAKDLTREGRKTAEARSLDVVGARLLEIYRAEAARKARAPEDARGMGMREEETGGYDGGDIGRDGSRTGEPVRTRREAACGGRSVR